MKRIKPIGLMMNISDLYEEDDPLEKFFERKNSNDFSEKMIRLIFLFS